MFLSLLQAKLETKALKAKRPGFTDDRYNETSYYIENGELLYICVLYPRSPATNNNNKLVKHHISGQNRVSS